MKLNILIAALAIPLFSCSTGSDKRTMVVVSPAHYHAALVQKNPIDGVSETVEVYAPEGEELEAYLNTVGDFNKRDGNPTRWVENLHVGDNCVESLKTANPGDFVVLACKNNLKADYILRAVEKGYNVLSDKPLAIDRESLGTLEEAYRLAEEKNLVILDLMTERHDILNILVRDIISDKDLFGELKGVSMTSVHHFYKNVNGSILKRPQWYYDISQQGEGIADVTTHLIDLVFWQCFPNKAVGKENVKLIEASHYPTAVTLERYRMSTGAEMFPGYLGKYIENDTLKVMSNGIIGFTADGIPMSIEVRWDFQAPEGSGDTFESTYDGSEASIKIIQDQSTDFRKTIVIDAAEAKAKEIRDGLKRKYPSLTIEPFGESWKLDVDDTAKTGHEDHFSMVLADFTEYLEGKELPDWEKINTLTKYDLTAKSVSMALIKQSDNEKE